MPRTQHDRDLVASSEPHEVYTISKKFNINKELTLQIMKDLGKDGKFCRSRRMIYAKIREIQEEAQVNRITKGLQKALEMQQNRSV